MRDRLTPGGALTLQAGMTKLGELDFFTSIHRTLREVFPVVAGYQTFISCFGTPWGFITATKKVDPLRQDVTTVDRLISEQMSDGGWNCEQERGSIRGSFHTTICVLEGLLEYERATGNSRAVTAARERGQEYLLERRMLRSLSTGEVIDPAWTRFSFPTGYHYDVLRGLEYLRSAAITPDARLSEASDLVVSKRDMDGRWLLENVHPDQLDAEPGVVQGQPSRWNTLRALRVLDWYKAWH